MSQAFRSWPQEHWSAPPWTIYQKASQMISPSPSMLWVTIDENPDSINDGGCAVAMDARWPATMWQDGPATAHGGACGFTFADGHSEIHKWRDGRTRSGLMITTYYRTFVYGLFQKEEDLEGCLGVCKEVFTRFGRPSAFYLDRASQFRTTRHRSEPVEPTQFQRAMSELGIRLIFAYSPQARGRGERINRAFQDRLVAELRLTKIADCERATTYLNTTFIPKYARLFGHAPDDPQAAWRALSSDRDLRNILCTRSEARVNYDNTISVKGQIIQLLPTRTRLSFAKASVTVNHWLDGTWHVFHYPTGEVPCTPIQGRGRPASSRHARPVSTARASL